MSWLKWLPHLIRPGDSSPELHAKIHAVKQEKEQAKRFFEDSSHLIEEQVNQVSKARETLEMAAAALELLEPRTRKRQDAKK